MVLAAGSFKKKSSAVVTQTRLALVPRHRPIALSLFSGGGGMDIGVERAGFQTLACVEIDRNCCETLRHNQPAYLGSAQIINEDVRAIDATALAGQLGVKPGELDLLYGGPPCQSFSQIGKMDGLSDERGRLLFEMVRFADVLHPKAIIIENVKALVNARDTRGVVGGIFAKLTAELKRLGYATSFEIINAADFGVAQLRKRVFVVALKEGMKFEFARPTHGTNGTEPYVTIATALKGLRAPTQNAALTRNNHVDITPCGDRRRISYVPEGEYLARIADAPASVKGRLSKKDTTKFLRLARDRQANTLRCGEIFFHPVYDRYLTPREYMRLHGFPNDYTVRGPVRGRTGRVRHLDQHRQIANSVPPPVAAVVATQVIKALQHMVPRAK